MRFSHTLLSPLLPGREIVPIGFPCLVFFLLFPTGGPEGGGAASGGLVLAADCVEEHQLLEGGIDTVGADVAMKETPDLMLR